MAVVFRLTSFDDGHQWTAITTPRGRRLFGPVAITYAAEPDGAGLPDRLSPGRGRTVARSPGPGRTRWPGATW